MNNNQVIDIDLENIFECDNYDEENVYSIPDALVLSLSNYGKVNMEYIMNITREDLATIISSLSGAIYQNPEKWHEDDLLGWETSDEYLSGNLRRKLDIARKANRTYKNRFKSNIDAINKIIPNLDVSKEIYVTLGSPWIPPSIIEDFISYLLNKPKTKIPRVRHDEHTGSWEIKQKNVYNFEYNILIYNTYGTSRMNAFQIIENTLNMRTIVVNDSYNDYTNNKKIYKINTNETLRACEKQKELIELFKNWIWTDNNRKKELEDIYESKYACIKKRIFDGYFLKLTGLSNKINLFKYQKDAIARIIFSPNTLLAHDVGCGKTYIMIASGMELRRMMLSKKNLYVVPNSIVSQWKNHFLELYPNANVLCVDSKNFSLNKQSETLKKIRDNDYDGIIMAYSCFDKIIVSKDTLLKNLKEEQEKIKQLLKGYKSKTTQLKLEKNKINKRIKAILEKLDSNADTIYFDDLGIDRLFLDEAHNYKNVPIKTNTLRIYGIKEKGSKKCQDMLEKVKYIQATHDGGGVIMATGTPITNSLTDVFVLQQYLQSGELVLTELHNFDSWTAMFAEKVTEFEIDVDTNNYRLATRFAKFHNLPELTSLLSSIADFHQIDEFVELPKFTGYTDILIEKTDEFNEYLKEISNRAERVRNNKVSKDIDNLLKITTDGRKAALDLRLVDNKAKFTIESKVFKCASIVYDIYVKSEKNKSTQLIFCDTSTPKAGFNIYDELKTLLINKGVKDTEIAFIHDANTESKRTTLFNKVKKGNIRILLGSTFKLGTGVNIQDKLLAIHHLDVPWRPSDMVQREGRILRQGNQNEQIYIYRYITKGSFDAYSWQILETKQKFIDKLLEGSITKRTHEDVQDSVLNYAEIKALSIGNSLIKDRVEITNEISRLSTLRQKEIEKKIQLQQTKIKLLGDINYKKDLSTKYLEDYKYYSVNKTKYDSLKMKEFKTKLEEAININLNTNQNQDIKVFTYQGFEIIVPYNIKEDNSYVLLNRNALHVVKLKDSISGAFIRMDNYLEKLDTLYKTLKQEIIVLKANIKEIDKEILKPNNYYDLIKELQDKLSEIDKKLGVKVK